MFRRRVLLVARIAVSLVLIVVVLSRVDIPRSLRVLGSAQPELVFLGLASGVLGVLISAYQWNVLLRADGIRLPVPTLIRLYFVGYTFSQLLPSTIGGDAIKAAYAARLSGRAVESVTGTLMTRVVGFGVLLVTALPVSIVASMADRRFGWWSTLVLAALGAAYVVGLLMLRHGHRLLDRRWWKRSGVGRTALELSKNFAESAHWRRPIQMAALLSLLFYLTLNFSYYFYGQAIHLRAPFWFYWVAVPVLSAVTVLPISLNGYGLREATIILLFRLANDTPAIALSLALIVEIQLLLFAIFGLLLLPAFRRRETMAPSGQPGVTSPL